MLGFIALVNWMVTVRVKTEVLATSGAVVSSRVKVIGLEGTSAFPSSDMIGPDTMKV